MTSFPVGEVRIFFRYLIQSYFVWDSRIHFDHTVLRWRAPKQGITWVRGECRTSGMETECRKVGVDEHC